MENSSITERLIDFGIDGNDCDEVSVPNDQQQQKEQQNQQRQPNNHLKQQQGHKHNKNNQPQTTNQSQHRHQIQQQTVSPSSTAKQNKSIKNSTKNSSKKISKIPRSPSCASNISYNSSFLHNLQHHTATSSSIPPQTPPLPANYQNKNKHMNGCSTTSTSTTATSTTATQPTAIISATPCQSISSAPSSPTPTPPTSAIPISATSNNSFFKSNKNNNKNTDNSNNVQIPSPPSTAGGLMVGGVMGANGNHSQHRGSVGGGGAGVGVSAGSVVNVSASRRPQIQISPITESSPKHYQYLTLTVRKDENGYGMKVSGDNPVYVESVKPGGAAQIAGLVAGDMILKVNGQEVRSEKHPTVVSLIKASTIVELAVKRTPKMARPNSIGIVPSTPILSGRDRTASITGPQPVDSIKRREMETYKIQTLQKMLEQEKLNLERLKGDINNPSYKLSEANIRKLREQLRQVGAEDAPPTKYPSATTNPSTLTATTATNNNNNNNKNTTFLSPTQLSASSHHQHHHFQQLPQQHSVHPLASTPQPHPPQSSPAFLSLLPRSLSSLSLGGRKNKIDKDLITPPLNNTTDFLQTSNSSSTPLAQQHLNMSQSLHQHRISSPQQQQLFYQHQQQLLQLQQHQHQLQQQQQQSQHRHKETPKSSNSSKHKNKFASQPKNLIKEDIPPPLPQRNPPRNLLLEAATATTVCSAAAISSNNSSSSSSNSNNSNINSNNNEWRRPMVAPVPVSDLDHSNLTTGSSSPQLRNSPQLIQATASPAPAGNTNIAASSSAQKKRSKIKTKALSDPKMSTQMFLQMETGSGCAGGEDDADCVPPPLPPRQPGMLEESSGGGLVLNASSRKGSINNLNVGIGGGSGGANSSSRPPPNSIDTLLNYPLVSTCTAVRDNHMSAAFPLSQRPNIVQQLQQHQQLHGGCGGGGGGGTITSVGGSGNSAVATAALGQTPPNLNHFNKHRRVVSSPENMHPRHPDRHTKTTSGSWDLIEKDAEVTPPGTPPPPYPSSSTHSHLHSHSTISAMSTSQHTLQGSFCEEPPNGGDFLTDSGTIFVESYHFTPLVGVVSGGGGGGGACSPCTGAIASGTISPIHAIGLNVSQKEIMSMEDEDTSDQEGIDENGPFNYLQRLLEQENVAFLAVFLNYVLSNSEPAPLLFYLITGLYKEGTAKDMRKWAYEIHSTFLVPRAPLSWYPQDESLAREVDNVLQTEFDKVEILRKVFWKSRKRARDIICEQLRELQTKRTAGLGTIFGPTDSQLAEARGDKQKEQHIFEDTLLRKLQFLIDEYEKDSPAEDPKKLALCSALSTVIHRIFITRSNPNSIIDRVHHFVSREKSFKSRLMGKNRKMIVRGHPLVLRQYYEVTHCNHCQTIIWGVSPQGYHCTDCKLNIHRPCSKVLDENCPGPLPQAKRKDPHNDNKISKLMGKIRPRTSSDFIAMEKRARHEEDFDPADFTNVHLFDPTSNRSIRPTSIHIMDGGTEPVVAPTVRRNPSLKRLLKLPWGSQQERLHSTSIVRQPSDRRPDAANASIRSNGNHAAAASSQHNNSELLHNSQASDASTGIISAADASVSSCGGSGVGGTSSAAAVFGGADTNAQDAADSSSRDSRKDRLQQQHQQNKSAPVSVNRSESYKERLSHKRSRNSRRKTSDPSLASRPNDDQPDLGLSNSNYTASSNSSLSSGGGSESPSTSMEQVATGAPGQHQQLQQPLPQQQQQQQLQQQYAAGGHQHQHHHHHHHHHQHSHQDSFHGSGGSGSTPNNSSFWGGSIGGAGGPTIGQLARQWQFESDEEDDLLMEADWSSNVAADILAAFTDAEKKRQEIINEIYQTERNHVRTLKLLERLFFCPLQDSGVLSMDHLLLLFPPALVSLRELHGTFEQKLKQRRIEHNHVVNQVGDLLAGMFDGQSGDELCDYAAQFCARQQIALEALKEKRRKDENLQKLLSKAESHKACRRLQLKDLLPTVLQRLTKYPLLFENLYKVTIRVVPDDVAEAEAIKRALESSKKILVDVNQAVKHAEDAHKLQNIQRKLDKSTFDKEEFKNLDLTQHRLIHDGSLTMKKNPGIQLHGLLFESMIVLLTKQDDKYSLKYLNATRISEVNNKPLSPIMNIDSETLVRQEAADKNSFFLIKTKTSQMLELRAPSSSECKTWFKHISDAAEQYKPRSKNTNHEPVDDPAIATLPHSNTKESLEITPERPPPLSATATMTTTPLAPMMMLPNSNCQHHQQYHQQHHHHHHPQQHQQQHLHHQQHSVDLRNGRDGTPTAEVGLPGSCSIFAHPSSVRSSRMTNNSDLASSVNRTMSTRSCGDGSSSNNNYSDRAQQLAQSAAAAAANGVTLRHTQSARQAAADGDTGDDALSVEGGGGSGSKRDSASIIYSNNSNNTRTLMQSSPLVEPTAIQISISPAHTAEPVLTPAEKLRRLDAAIRDGLLEKQKIICDMFRLPIEHFHEIVDIASLPEAPKDSADIALATYAQVQSLTEVVNEYMKVTPDQEISAVSTSVCDQCHEKQRKQQQHQQHQQQHQLHSYSNTNSNNSVFRAPLAPMTPQMPTSRSTSSSLCAAASPAVQLARSPSPPPLPPPNKQQAQAQHKTATPSAKLQTHSIDEQIIHEDDDGYCEIDELRLPALPSMMPASMMAALLSKPAPTAAAEPPPPLPPPAGTFKTPPPPPPPPASMTAKTPLAPAAVIAASAAEQTVLKSSSPELTKRQSTISAESIPEESADEVTEAMGDDGNGDVNKALLSSKPASSATAAEATKSADTEKEEDEPETALQKVSIVGEEVSQRETPSSVQQTLLKQEEQQEQHQQKRESPQEQEPGDDQKKSHDPDRNREQDVPGQQEEKAKEEQAEEEKEKDQKQAEPTAVAEVTSNISTSATATATVIDHAADEAEKDDKDVVASAEPQHEISAASVEEDSATQSGEQNMEVNDASVETLAALNKLRTALIMVDSMSQTTLTGSASGGGGTTSYCGPNRVTHATSLEPSVPCHALNSIVTALNVQISLLLPKINERDMERERLRKENQHLRELLNAMHERQRVEAKIETPKDITKSAEADATDEIDAPSNSKNNTNSNTNAINTSNNNSINNNINSKAPSTTVDVAATESPAAADK